jgi:hypothetical protein
MYCVSSGNKWILIIILIPPTCFGPIFKIISVKVDLNQKEQEKLLMYSIIRFFQLYIQRNFGSRNSILNRFSFRNTSFRTPKSISSYECFRKYIICPSITHSVAICVSTKPTIKYSIQNVTDSSARITVLQITHLCWCTQSNPSSNSLLFRNVFSFSGVLVS